MEQGLTPAAFKKKYKDARKALVDMSQEAFRELAQQVFSKYQDVASFSWVQYTPYWNDGDPCVFSVHNYEECIEINGEEQEYGGAHPACSYIVKMLGGFPGEILRDVFGDHCKVIVHKDGKAEVEEYEHE